LKYLPQKTTTKQNIKTKQKQKTNSEGKLKIKNYEKRTGKKKQHKKV
jgi:hypothetical protein